jgi:hypothetical protein
MLLSFPISRNRPPSLKFLQSDSTYPAPNKTIDCFIPYDRFVHSQIITFIQLSCSKILANPRQFPNNTASTGRQDRSDLVRQQNMAVGKLFQPVKRQRLSLSAHLESHHRTELNRATCW